jgi:hypothetical protein
VQSSTLQTLLIPQVKSRFDGMNFCLSAVKRSVFLFCSMNRCIHASTPFLFQLSSVKSQSEPPHFGGSRSLRDPAFNGEAWLDCVMNKGKRKTGTAARAAVRDKTCSIRIVARCYSEELQAANMKECLSLLELNGWLKDSVSLIQRLFVKLYYIALKIWLISTTLRQSVSIT